MSGTIFWFLLLGALFFFMMRKGGCGMHAHGGHGNESHEGHDGQRGSGRRHPVAPGEHIMHHRGRLVRDPVCGMAIEESRATQSVIFEGEEYFFCSESCFESFKNEPTLYFDKTMKDHFITNRAS